MVPHSLLVASDRQFDFALQLLTLVVSGAIAISLLYLAFTLVTKPQPDRGDVGPPRWAAMPESLIDPWHLDIDTGLPPLPRNGVVYRCDRNGRVSYGDRPCPDGRVRLLPTA
jgi:hypothetical protein